MCKEIVINKQVYRYSNTDIFYTHENKQAHCTIKVQRYVVINMTGMWLDVKNWDTLDNIIGVRNGS